MKLTLSSDKGVVDSATRLFCLAEELTHIRRMSRAAIAAEMRAIAKALVE